MKLPVFTQLSEEQIEIYGLPLEGKWTVTGPPGTGKSVMALYRTKMLCDENRPVTTMVHSKLLQQYVNAAEGELEIPDGHIRTFHSWLWKYWRDEFGSNPPTKPDNRWEFDWDEIHRTLNHGVPPITPDLIIDEGQDLPVDFYILCRMLSEHVTVFADEAQTIKEGNASVQDIRNRLPSTEDETFQLRKNYRNSRAIAEFAKHFYNGLPSGVPDLPEVDGSLPIPPPIELSFDESVDKVDRWMKINEEKTVGIFLPTNKLVNNFHAALQKKARTAARKKKIQCYTRGNKSKAPEIDFTKPGAVISWFGNAKGLEFDAVFVCELTKGRHRANDPLTRNLLYVLASRARTTLEFHYSEKSDLLATFPPDSR